MIILLKNKQALKIDDHILRCLIGKNGLTSKKKEGDKKPPKGTFAIGNLYYRQDRLAYLETKLKTIQIKRNMGWCDDTSSSKNYNKPIKIPNTFKHEKLFRKDQKYDLLIPIKYNFNKPKIPDGSCIFFHLTSNYKPTAGCIALKKKDFLILIKLINRNTKLVIS